LPYAYYAHGRKICSGDIAEKPANGGGIVQVMTVTEQQFAGMEYITGKFSSDVIDSDERLIIL
jgi:CRISPR-associated protein Cas2